MSKNTTIKLIQVQPYLEQKQNERETIPENKEAVLYQVRNNESLGFKCQDLNNPEGIEFLKAFRDSQHLKRVHLLIDVIRPDFAELFFDLISENRSVEEFTLTVNDISVKSIKENILKLNKSPNIQNLKLSLITKDNVNEINIQNIEEGLNKNFLTHLEVNQLNNKLAPTTIKVTSFKKMYEKKEKSADASFCNIL